MCNVKFAAHPMSAYLRHCHCVICFYVDSRRFKHAALWSIASLPCRRPERRARLPLSSEKNLPGGQLAHLLFRVPVSCRTACCCARVACRIQKFGWRSAWWHRITAIAALIHWRNSRSFSVLTTTSSIGTRPYICPPQRRWHIHSSVTQAKQMKQWNYQPHLALLGD